MPCPRCERDKRNTFTMTREGLRVPVHKCLVCGFIWIEDNDLIGLAKKEVKSLFLKDLMVYGKRKKGTK